MSTHAGHPGRRVRLFLALTRPTYTRRLAEAGALVSDTSRPIGVFVHAHTHLADSRQRVLDMTRLGRTVIVDGFSPVPGALTPIVVNGGAWQRTITPASSSG